MAALSPMPSGGGRRGVPGARARWGAAKPADRTLVLVVAGVSKVIFVVLVLSEGTRYLSYQAGVAIAIDSVMVILFAW